MADIFISFAKADRNLAQQLAAQLEAQSRTTWWDADVRDGQNSRSIIDRELDSAHKVIVIWSKTSVASPFVLHEAIAARDAGKLLQVKTSDIQVSDIPRPLRALTPLNASDMAAIVRAVAPTRRLSVSNEKSDVRVYPLAAITVAVAAAAVIWQPELSDALSMIANRLLALLK